VTRETPFEGMNAMQLIAAKAMHAAGPTLPLPPCHPTLAGIMQECWAAPEGRPTFVEMLDRLCAIVPETP
jgi:hypothetical protein